VVTIVENISRRERKKAETRDRIVSAAIRIFSDRNVEDVTVDEIASAADIGKGTIYNYFQSKEEIVVAFLLTIEQKVQKRIQAYSSAPGPLQDLLVSFLQFQLKLKSPYHQFVRVFFSHMFARGSSSSTWIRQLQRAIDPPLECLFRMLQERGLVRPDIPRQDLIQLFKMLHVGLMTVWVMEGPPWKATEHLLRQQMKIFCEGIEVKTK
jgi:AcrR family transcriptional regulator